MASAAQTFTTRQGVNAAPASAAQRARPFCQAAQFGSEFGPNYSFTPGTGVRNFGPTPLPATGYLRRILLETVFTGGAGAGVLAADGPFNAWNLIRLTEPNGAPVFELSGYNTLLADIFGGYAGVNDPRNDPDFSATANNPVFQPFIPIEIDPTGVGALSNLSASSAFRLTLLGEAIANIWSTAPTTIPTANVNVIDDYWTLPNPVDQDGNPQATYPPFPGTIQLWSQILNVGLQAGNQRTQLNRMGNQLRTIIMVTRAVGGARSDTPFPNPLTLRWDDINLRNEDPMTLRKKMREFVVGMTARDVGVYAFNFNTGIGRQAGGSGVSSYLPTVTATRFELSGPSGAAGTIDWLVNDVSAAPVSGVQRSTVGGGLGYYPPVAPSVPGAM